MARRAMSVVGQMAELKAEYAAARPSKYRRTRNVPASGAGGNYHLTESEFLRVMEYARDMDRNDVAVGPLFDAAVRNIVQGGFRMDAETGDAGLDAELQARWVEWSEDPLQCDVAGERTFCEMETAVLRSALRDGDVFGVVEADTGALNLIEAHRCRTPTNTKQNVVLGVLVDDARRPQEYWFAREDLEPRRALTRVGDVARVAAVDGDGWPQVLHVKFPKRISQTRGVSALAPVFDTAGMFEDLNFAKLVQAQVVSCIAFLRFQSPQVAAMPVTRSGARGEASTEALSDGGTLMREGLRPGMELRGRPGEELRGFSPNVPNAEFFPHVRLILQLLGANLGIPLILLLMDAAETNFSGWRGAMDQAKLGFQQMQKSLGGKFHRNVWRWKVRQWAAEDRAIERVGTRDGVKLYGLRIFHPRWPYVQPLQDAQTALLEMRNALASPRRIQAERGRDWDEVYKEIVADNAAAIAHAAQEAKRLQGMGVDVTWRELLCLPTPDGVTVQLGNGTDGTNGTDGARAGN